MNYVNNKKEREERTKLFKLFSARELKGIKEIDHENSMIQRLFFSKPYCTHTHKVSLYPCCYIDLQLTEAMSVAQSLLLVSVSLYHREGIQAFRWKCGKMSNKKLVFKKSRILHLQIFLPFSNGHQIKVLCNIFLHVIMSDLSPPKI